MAKFGLVGMTFLFLPLLGKAQIESKAKMKADTTAKIDTPQIIEMTMSLFRDSTWGKGGLNTRMTKTSSKVGKMERVYKPVNVNTIKFDDLIIEYYNADATIIVRDIIKMPLQSHQDQTEFILAIQKELKAVKLEIRRVRSDLKTEKLGSFKLLN